MSARVMPGPVPAPRRRPVDIIAEVMKTRGIRDEALAADMAVSTLQALRAAGYSVSAAERRSG
jgi:hypothetical protein